jgi:hypothetical protein
MFASNMVEWIYALGHKIRPESVRFNTDQEPTASDIPNLEFKFWKIIPPKMAKIDQYLMTLDLTLICEIW